MFTPIAQTVKNNYRLVELFVYVLQLSLKIAPLSPIILIRSLLNEKKDSHLIIATTES